MSDYIQKLLDSAAQFSAAGVKGKSANLYQQVLQHEPNHVFALAALGSLRLEEGRLMEADLLLNRSVRATPAGTELDPAIRANAALAARMLGVWAQSQGRKVEAELALSRALDLTPDDAIAKFHMAMQSPPEQAEALYRDAAAAMPDQAGPVINLGLLLAKQGRRAEAEALFRDAVARAPDLAEAHMNLAFLLLGDGKLAEGWAEYEWRVRWLHYRAPIDRPAWDGAAAPEATLLLWAEQGLGDSLMAARFIPLAAAQVGRVIVQVQPSLVALFRRQNWPVEVIAWDDPVPEAVTRQASLMSLPLLLGARLEDLPGRGGYLTAAAAFDLPDPAAPGEKIGLVWSGNKAHPAFHRAMPCSALTRIANIPDLRLFSLQVGDAAAELQRQPWAARVVDLAPRLVDLDAAAAAIAAMDRIVTIDTSIAHLAGALGKPTLVLLSPEHCWRWLADGRADSPWYDSLRLIRAARTGHWRDAVITAVGLLSQGSSGDA